jgi:hypothetical protein
MNMKLAHTAFALLLGAASLGCGSKSTPGSNATPDAAGGGTDTPIVPGNVSKGAGSCAKNDIQVAFSPMFSAYDSIHTFQVPAIVSGIAASAITWSASNPAMVGLQADATSGGVLITILKAGTVDIIATAGTVCGSSKLTITQAVDDDWTSGDMRYNNGVVLVRPSRMGRDGGPGDGAFPGMGDDCGSGRPEGGGGRPEGGADRPDGGGMGGGGIGMVADGGSVNRIACTNCHGPTANGPYKTVSHTPTQIGGFSDDQLKGIFNGIWPTGSGNPFDTTIVAQRVWEGFHKWDMTDDEAAGVIVYLRALTPAPQTGSRNFGGATPGGRDGGPPRPPVDGGASSD